MCICLHRVYNMRCVSESGSLKHVKMFKVSVISLAPKLHGFDSHSSGTLEGPFCENTYVLTCHCFCTSTQKCAFCPGSVNCSWLRDKDWVLYLYTVPLSPRHHPRASPGSWEALPECFPTKLFFSDIQVQLLYLEAFFFSCF